jgi:aminoglycoside/choline kinase family phosphotransferase
MKHLNLGLKKTNKQINNQINHVIENNLLSEEKYGYIQKKINNLIKHVDNNSSVYCHNDFFPKNIF